MHRTQHTIETAFGTALISGANGAYILSYPQGTYINDLYVGPNDEIYSSERTATCNKFMYDNTITLAKRQRFNVVLREGITTAIKNMPEDLRRNLQIDWLTNHIETRARDIKIHERAIQRATVKLEAAKASVEKYTQKLAEITLDTE